ncbi:hypothetical protein ACX9R5_06560 [Rathayibacter sp. CAU 1779]
MSHSELASKDIVDFTVAYPDGWHQLPFVGTTAFAGWPERLGAEFANAQAASTESAPSDSEASGAVPAVSSAILDGEAISAPVPADALLRQLRRVQKEAAETDPDGTSQWSAYVPFPLTGLVAATLQCSFLWLQPDDSPESYRAEVAAHAGDRAVGYEIRGLQTWRSAHHDGDSVGFTHVTVISEYEGGEAFLEQRVVFVVFPVGAAQAVQFVFRSAYVGAFADMVTETQAIVDSLRVRLAS